MNNEHHDIDRLIAKELSGEASVVEQKQLDDWKALSVENVRYYEDAIQVWVLTQSKSDAVFDTDVAWENVKNEAFVPTKTKVITLHRLMQVAAVFLVGVFVSYYFVKNEEKEVPGIPLISFLEVHTTTIDTLLLNDDTRITARENATISYPEVFDSIRRVNLKGRAYFEVSKAALHPFIITTSRGIIQVVGTSFYVDTESDSALTVVVSEGKVKVALSEVSDQSVFLTKGQKVTLKKGGFVEEQVKAENHLAWRTHQIKFRKEKLPEVVNVLSSTFGVAIVLKNERLKNCELTARYSNKSLEVILENIKQTFNVKITTTEKGIEIEEGGC